MGSSWALEIRRLINYERHSCCSCTFCIMDVQVIAGRQAEGATRRRSEGEEEDSGQSPAIDPNPDELGRIRMNAPSRGREVRTGFCCKRFGGILFRGERLIKSGYSWLSTKVMEVTRRGSASQVQSRTGGGRSMRTNAR